MCVVKGNAYGRGISEITEILKDSADYFAVFSVSELHKIRKITDKPVLLMGFIGKDEIPAAINLNAEFSVHNINRLRLLSHFAKTNGKILKVHLEIDALFGRMGISTNELPSFLKQALSLKNIEIFAAYAHLSCVTNRKGNVCYIKQIKEYSKALKILSKFGYTNIKTHLASTSGALVYNNKNYDFIRLGAGLYGMWTSDEIKEASPIQDFKPVFRWVTHITQVRELPSDYPIGYGATFITKKRTKIAIIPQGYTDGYDCKMSNTGEVLIKGKRCKILGRVSMNMITADVTNIVDVRDEEDEVVLIGWQANEEIKVDELATIVGTMHAEITCRLNPDLPRIIID